MNLRAVNTGCVGVKGKPTVQGEAVTEGIHGDINQVGFVLGT
jgi:hypothetical protein